MQSLSQLKTNFDQCLAEAIDTGKRPGSAYGFDTDVHRALVAVADEYPSATSTSIQNANKAIRALVMGTHREQTRAEIADIGARLGFSATI